MRHIALSLALAIVAPLADAGCLPVLGTVRLTPDAACGVATVPGMEGQPFIGECFKTVLSLGGLLPAYGYSGVTTEPLTGLLPPNAVAASPATLQGGRNVLTARTTFSLGGTRFYAAEVVIDSGNGIVTEQSVITGTDGKGLFRNATGNFAILGNSINETAQIRGQICTP